MSEPGSPFDRRMMQRALELADRGAGWASPNPLVGAVVCQGEEIVGEGYHPEVGEPHAEPIALDQAGVRAKGGTLYVTLEPCAHHGRTPPCLDRVIASGVSRVVIGMEDPDPRTEGRSIRALKEKGIEVDVGVLETEAKRLNLPFISRVTRGRPWVSVKYAMTLDGRIAASTGDSKWISNETSRRFVHVIRRRHRSILVGYRTYLTDDPMLTCRLDIDPPPRQPLRIVYGGDRGIRKASNLVQSAQEAPVMQVVRESDPVENPPSVETLRFPESDLGEIVNWILGVSAENDVHFVFMARVWGTVAIVAAVTLTWVNTYAALEKTQTVILVFLLGSVFVACVVARPDWLEALVGAFVPSVPEYGDWVIREYPDIVKRPPWVEVLTYVGAIGGGTYDYIGYIGCLREKKWGAIGTVKNTDATDFAIDTEEENLRRGRGWLVPPKVDTGVSFLCVVVFSICFGILGAAVLNPARTVPAGRDLLTHQEKFLTAIHPSLSFIYQIGIFFAFWGTMYGAYEIYTRTTYECFAPISRRLRETPLRKYRLGVLTYCGIGGLILLWTVDDPVGLVTPAALVGGVFTCGLWCFAMIWADRKFIPEPLKMGKVLLTLTALSGIVLTVLGVKGMWDFVIGQG